MYNMLIHSHSGLRWFLLSFLILSIAKAYPGWKNNKSYTAKDQKINLITMTLFHIQMILGFLLYIGNWGGKVNFKGMKDSMMRFYTVEHLFMMIIAIILVTIGYSLSKRNKEKAFKIVFIYYLIALIFILAGIPWPFRASLGAGWY